MDINFAIGRRRVTAGVILLAVLFAPASLRAAGQSSGGQSTGKSRLSITFVSDGRTTMSGGSAGAAMLDIGDVAAATHGKRTTVIRREIFVRLVNDAGTPGIGTLRAALEVEDRNHRVRINGVLLSTVPQVVDANAVVGLAVRHVIEIEVPHAEPAGDLLSSITWTAEVL